MEYEPAIVLLDPSRADSDDVTAYHRAVNFTISRGAESRCNRRNHHLSARVNSRENANAAESRRLSPYETFVSPRHRRARIARNTDQKKKERSCLRLLRRATNTHALDTRFSQLLERGLPPTLAILESLAILTVSLRYHQVPICAGKCKTVTNDM